MPEKVQRKVAPTATPPRIQPKEKANAKAQDIYGPPDGPLTPGDDLAHLFEMADLVARVLAESKGGKGKNSAKRTKAAPVSVPSFAELKKVAERGGGNSYLRAVKMLAGGDTELLYPRLLAPLDLDRSMIMQMVRPAVVGHYGLAIPDATAIKKLAALSPLVEIGAGGGYWAYLLRRAGAKVTAVDRAPPHDGDGRKSWSEVLRGDHREAARHPCSTLFLCWPPHQTRMAYDAVRAFRGKTIAYIGEGRGGCTADDRFFDLMARDWVQRECVTIPRWPYMKDALWIFDRKTG